MPSGRNFKPSVFHIFIFIWILLFIVVSAQSRNKDFAGIARRARKEAEQKVRRDKDASRVRIATAKDKDKGADSAAGSGSRGRSRALSAAEKFAKVHGTRTVPPAVADKARVFQLASKKFLERNKIKADSLTPESDAATGFITALSGICADQPTCDIFYRYRTANGTCNNLLFPLQGSHLTPQPRYLLPDYNDYFKLDEPRQIGVNGQLLPSPRHISSTVHRGDGAEVLASDLTLMMMVFGQFTDHDFALTPISAEPDGTPIECCTRGVINPSQQCDRKPKLNPECFYIPLPDSEPHFPSSYKCLNFVRSLPAVSSSCFPGPRQQLNLLTSYIDGSNVYGSTQEEQDNLRTKIGGLLKMKGANLPEDPNGDCELTSNPNDYCFMAGDERVSEQPSLSMIHTVFVREHNRLAEMLASANPSWDDENIYQEARKIIVAEIQHITYNEYLPIVLGDDYMTYFELYSKPSGFDYLNYNIFIDASIVNVFAAATFRYGHSQVPNELKKNYNIGGPSVQERQLEDNFFKTNMILEESNGADKLARYAATANSHLVDSRIEQSILDKLFKNTNDPHDSLDLPALNIQRGRDHGLPPYNKYRELCGRDPYLSWDDTFDDHTPADVEKLKKAYDDPRDIDMFPGALSEKPVQGGLLGPTNACILANQFRSLKKGDRFFYENPSSPLAQTGFTRGQLDNIKTTRLARIICKNMNTPKVQPNIFRNVGIENPLGNCNDLPDINIATFWSAAQSSAQEQSAGTMDYSARVATDKGKEVPKFLVPKTL